jgi:HlyD family secretion protein
MSNDITLAQTKSVQPYGVGEDEALQADDPSREIRFGIIVSVMFFVLFLGWAAFAHLDAAAYAQGQLVVSGQRQTVQHRDGGFIGAILVKEGQRVAKDQTLIELAGAEVRAQERALSSQVIGLMAQRARLRAQQAGTAIVWPAEFSAMAGDDRADALATMQLQNAELQAGRQVLSAQTGALGQQASQSIEGAVGSRKEMQASAEQERLLTEEIDSLRPLAEKGYVSKSRMRALERARADLQGERGRFQSNVAQSGSSASESRLKQLETAQAYRLRGAAELREVEFTLGELIPKQVAARDQLQRLTIRAPDAGTIVGLSVFSPGGVISPGQRLMDVVPDNATLVIDARISVDEADDLKIGQEAEIRLTGLHERAIPVLKGKVTRLSADSFVDEKSGMPYYTATISLPPSQVALIQQVRGKQFILRAGSPAQVIIPLRKRTALQYAFEPLTDTFWRSFREN